MEGSRCYSCSLQNPVETIGCSATASSTSDLDGVPEVYHDFADVFSKGKAYNLAPHREYDLKIDIDENVKQQLNPIYSLSESELRTL